MNPEDAPPASEESLVSLLSQLHGLREPDAVSMTPETPAWFVLGGIILLALALLFWRWTRHRRANAYRREALALLARIAPDLTRGNPAALPELDRLLRRTALAVYPRAEVASLTGADWARYLDERADTPLENGFTACAPALTDAPYRAGGVTFDGARLRDLAHHWITHHHA
ncbi:DUF4381 domain-containing protein [Falsirhodobacter sp. alg1]|uniref:DUF4381 domain-containing protein n=1 Tax=Falsirhodobacter sp. alg1 TaxID=1472418 RepID=UPI000693DECF|nr:DUF4381 domain-containing protein [Falsirhodobacter sp. alg1]